VVLGCNGVILCVFLKLSGSKTQNSLERGQKRSRCQSQETRDNKDGLSNRGYCAQKLTVPRAVDTPLDSENERGRHSHCSSNIFRKRRESLGPLLAACFVTIL
jgi:hypothetical protein